MNDTLTGSVTLMEAIYRRRAVRSFAPQPVDEARIRQLLLAAVQAPSAMNQQPWAFAVFHGDRRLRELSERAKVHLIGTAPTAFELHSRSELYENPRYDLFHLASTLIVIYAVRGRSQPNEDCCLAAENLMLAAYALGLATCPVGFARGWFDLPETKREFEVPEHYTAVMPIAVGYPSGFTPAPERDEPNIVAWKWDDV